MRERIRACWSDLLAGCLLVCFVLLSLHASRQESVTIDEFRHLSTGVYYWQSGDYAFDAATPPLWKMAMALPTYLSGAKTVRLNPVPDLFKGSEPWLVATDFMRDNASSYNTYLQSARMVNILAAALCIILLYGHCRTSFGAGPALVGATFFALSPTFLAHSHYATTDVIATLTMGLLLFLLVGYGRNPTAWRLGAVALAFSLALLCKYSVILLLPLVLVMPLLVVLKEQWDRFAVLPVVVALARSLMVIFFILLLSINLFYGFSGTGTPLAQLHLESKSLSALAKGRAGTIPMPLPKAFIEGFDRQKADSDYAEFPAYLNGTWSADGFRTYYLSAFLLKESIPFLVLVCGGLIWLVRQLRSPLHHPEHWLYLYLPVALLIVLSCMNRLNIGVRYLLPAYPILCLGIAGMCRQFSRSRIAVVAILLLVGTHLTSVVRISPHYTSYFNEGAGGAEHGFEHLIDSNLDWGQDLPSLKQFMKERNIPQIQLAYFGHALPEYYGIRYEPLTLPIKPGYVAISATLLVGQPYLLTYLSPPQIVEFDRFRSLRALEPIGRAGCSIFIYKVTSPF